jgi:hypothetical protein
MRTGKLDLVLQCDGTINLRWVESKIVTTMSGRLKDWSNKLEFDCAQSTENDRNPSQAKPNRKNKKSHLEKLCRKKRNLNCAESSNGTKNPTFAHAKAAEAMLR